MKRNDILTNCDFSFENDVYLLNVNCILKSTLYFLFCYITILILLLQNNVNVEWYNYFLPIRKIIYTYNIKLLRQLSSPVLTLDEKMQMFQIEF